MHTFAHKHIQCLIHSIHTQDTGTLPMQMARRGRARSSARRTPTRFGVHLRRTSLSRGGRDRSSLISRGKNNVIPGRHVAFSFGDRLGERSQRCLQALCWHQRALVASQHRSGHSQRLVGDAFSQHLCVYACRLVWCGCFFF